MIGIINSDIIWRLADHQTVITAKLIRPSTISCYLIPNITDEKLVDEILELASPSIKTLSMIITWMLDCGNEKNAIRLYNRYHDELLLNDGNNDTAMKLSVTLAGYVCRDNCIRNDGSGGEKCD